MVTIANALRFAIENPYSDLYRRKYGTSYSALINAELSNLPLLSREELEGTPLFKRLFMPREMVRYIRATSGSSGRRVIGIPMLEEPELLEYRASLGFGSSGTFAGRYFGPYFMSSSTYSLLVFSAMGLVHEAHLAEREGHPFVMGDFSDPTTSARLAVAAGVDSIFAFLTPLITIAPYLAAAGLSERITFILLAGERVQELQRRRLIEIFPNARLATMYASTESQALAGYTCPLAETIAPNRIHIAPTFHAELIDQATQQSLPFVPSAEGELCLTSTVPLAVPLIRYCTGDYVTVHRRGPCVCGSPEPLIEVLGRAEFDRVKVPYGGINVAALEAAVAELPFHIADFSAVFDQRSDPVGLSITLYTDEGSEINEVQLISERLHISSTRTYAHNVHDGLLAPLTVEHAPKEKAASLGKRKRLTILR